MKSALLFSVLVGVMVACAPEVGQVVGKHYEPAYQWTQQNCAAFNAQGGCVVFVPVTFEQPEQWVLALNDGVDEGDRAVAKDVYDRCRIGDSYPACGFHP